MLLHIASDPTGGTAWPVCFQMQLKLTRAGDLLPMNGAKFAEKLSTPPEAKTPQLDRAAESSERPLGEWNVCDIICRGDTIEVMINGVFQNKITQCACQPRARLVSNSKAHPTNCATSTSPHWSSTRL